MSIRTELEEIGHTGGKVTFKVKVSPEGRTSYSVGYSHSGPWPASLFAVYAIRQGVAVDDIDLGGIGTPWNAPPVPDCFPVFIASDSTGMIGHQCPSCSGYWRGSHGGKICPYCGREAEKSCHLLTSAQQQYVVDYCELLNAALHSGVSGDHVIDMDAVADAVGKEAPKPAFYYAEEQQQNLFACEACDAQTDVLGTFAYCASCGTRNEPQELAKSVNAIRNRANSGGPFEACVRDAVAAFDSLVSQYAHQLVNRVPLTPARRSRIEAAGFHNLMTTRENLMLIFGVDIFAGVSSEDTAFAKLMFHRRHIYEHNGGEADAKYIADSGDQVRLKQALRESRESAHRIASVVTKMAANLHQGFHQIFPPKEERIRERN